MTSLLLMIAPFLFVGAAALWWLTAIKRKNVFLQGAVFVQLGGVVSTLVGRGDLPPAGWASVAVIACWLPALFVLNASLEGRRSSLFKPLAIACLLSALWSATPAGAGVALWSPWSVPHIVVSVIAMGAAVGAGMVALTILRGRRLGLALCALVLTALPLTTERASSVIGYIDGAPADVRGELRPADGATGVIRTLPARLQVPGERTLRWVAASAVLLWLSLMFVRYLAGLDVVRRNGFDWFVLACVAAHVLLCAKALLPLPLAEDSNLVIESARSTLALESSEGRPPSIISAPKGPYTGGAGSPTVVLSLALLSMALLFGASEPRQEGRERELIALESQFAAGALVMMVFVLLTGVLWSNYSWGGVITPDPKLYAAAASMGLYGLYFYSRKMLAQFSDLPSWLLLIALSVMLLSMLGPELGITAPSLHHFGA